LIQRRRAHPLSRQLGVSFRRQVVIGRYIVDFCALSLKLVVEVDGTVHALKRASDRRRTEKLERAGYRVLRLDARLVVRDLPRAVALIRAGARRVSRTLSTSPCRAQRSALGFGEVGAAKQRRVGATPAESACPNPPVLAAGAAPGR
jgi:very-short-patch-repair endonuclease